MFTQLLNNCRRSIQFKLFLSLTLIVALSLTAILACQVYLVQDYFIHQEETNLRGSNYLLSRVLADPLYAKDLALLQSRLDDIQTKLPICNFQLKNDIGKVVYKVGEIHALTLSDLGAGTDDNCYNTVLPVVHGNQLIGTVRMGVRTDDITQTRASLIHQSIFFAMFWFAIFMLPFFIQIRRLTSPLASLSKAALEISNGNLNYPTPTLLRSEDEISYLINSFNGMTQSLIRSREEQAASLDALKSEKLTLNTLLSTMPVGVIFVDRTHIRYCNDHFRTMLQVSPNDKLEGKKNEDLLLYLSQHVVDVDLMFKDIAEILATRSLTEPKFILLKNGSTLRLISNVVISSDNNSYLGRFWIFEDYTRERKVLQTAELNAELDSLTSIYNRRRFDIDLSRLIAQAERDNSLLALLMFDLDHFKPINDKYGHNAGDTVLRRIAQELPTHLRRNEILYRIGGDEFAVLLVNSSAEEAEIIAERVIHLVRSLEFDFNGDTEYVGCSMGISRYPMDALTADKLFEQADLAMYAAKQRGNPPASYKSSSDEA